MLMFSVDVADWDKLFQTLGPTVKMDDLCFLLVFDCITGSLFSNEECNHLPCCLIIKSFRYGGAWSVVHLYISMATLKNILSWICNQ